MTDLHHDLSVLNKIVKEKYLHTIPEAWWHDFNNGCELTVDYSPWLKCQNPLPQWLASAAPECSSALLLDKARGALVGLAVADAVGTTLEFLPRDQKNISDMVGGGPFGLNPGEWTDDTSMALCLAETCLHYGKVDLTDFRNRMVNWYHYGVNSVNGICFDIGNATRYALDSYLQHGPEWFGNTDANTAGNAAIIRQAPVAVANRHSLLNTLVWSELQGKATHCATESVDCSRLFGVILHHLLNGKSKAEALSTKVCPLNARSALINAGSYRHKTRDEIRSSGYVIDTLEAALWAVWHTDNFRDAVLLAANLADDADSVAATAGQLAGALYGWQGIPAEWRTKLAQHEHIVSLADRLFQLSSHSDA
ncbi:ADP-ribosylglycohydrolase [Mangrovibacter phragmitis]|uniref:ADP-ribosylglycohydrolase n=1 Tax=Mangrovibacter phragmitis TaxID=1691903 RepID=A0A1B7L3A9_9ENTR|nr:ADP-ribosylarginine hydrolase Tri1 [Mangrovibacter phragmitis]OAT76892.1 ADP-ribosylglycohydrolase [Mangrovibacter phragmitis]